MSTITAPTRITFSTAEIEELIREAAIKKHPALQDEEFEIQILREHTYTVEPSAVVLVIT